MLSYTYGTVYLLILCKSLIQVSYAHKLHSVTERINLDF